MHRLGVLIEDEHTCTHMSADGITDRAFLCHALSPCLAEIFLQLIHSHFPQSGQLVAVKLPTVGAMDPAKGSHVKGILIDTQLGSIRHFLVGYPHLKGECKAVVDSYVRIQLVVIPKAILVIDVIRVISNSFSRDDKVQLADHFSLFVHERDPQRTVHGDSETSVIGGDLGQSEIKFQIVNEGIILYTRRIKPAVTCVLARSNSGRSNELRQSLTPVQLSHDVGIVAFGNIVFLNLHLPAVVHVQLVEDLIQIGLYKHQLDTAVIVFAYIGKLTEIAYTAGILHQLVDTSVLTHAYGSADEIVSKPPADGQLHVQVISLLGDPVPDLPVQERTCLGKHDEDHIVTVINRFLLLLIDPKCQHSTRVVRKGKPVTQGNLVVLSLFIGLRGTHGPLVITQGDELVFRVLLCAQKPVIGIPISSINDIQ